MVIAMYVGRVNSVSYINSYAVGRVGFPSARMPVQPVSPVGGKYSSTEGEVNRASDRLTNVFLSSDGDRAEISKKATSLFIDRFDTQQDEPDSLNNYRSDLPNSLIIWAQFRSNPENTLDFYNSASLQYGTMTPVSKEGAGPPVSLSPKNSAASVSLDALKPRGECKTCAGRRYVDKSDDPSVSYQTPTSINPNTSAAAVASHENEHVSNERGNAQREERQIVSQTVTLTYDSCPECGRSYVSGGTTRTTSVGSPDSGEQPQAPAGATPYPMRALEEAAS